MADENLLKVIKKGADAWNLFRREDVRPHDFSSAKLAGLDLRILLPPEKSDYRFPLNGVNLCLANLSNTDLRGAKLINAYFVGANLQGANLTRADVRNASFREANLNGADLTGTDLRTVDLVDATLEGARFSEFTFWPANYDPVAHGAVLVGAGQFDFGFEISFSPDISPIQIKAVLEVLADYFRACGGVGFVADFGLEEVLNREGSYV